MMPNALVADIQSVPDAQKMCKECGLCCRGIWFSYGVLDESEVDFAQRVGLRVQTTDGAISFPIPCALHSKDGCGVYDVWRPKVCGQYSCALLDRYVEGDIALEEALLHVKSAREMADRVQNEVGTSVGWLFGKGFLSRLEESEADQSSAFPPLSPAAKLDTLALRIYYKKYFKK